MDAKRITGIALVLAASALWGASGPLTKILRLDGFDITDILSWRYFIGFLSLTAFSTVLSKPPAFRIGSARFKAAIVMALCIFGVNAALVALAVITVTYRRPPGPPLGRLAPRRCRFALTPGRSAQKRTSVPGTGSPAGAASRVGPGGLGLYGQ